MPDNTTSKDRLKEITASIEDGIKDLFQSEKYMQYLRTMSRFHKYSVNNTMLIYMQKPDATLCAGFNKWKDQFSRNVMKGEKGIKIIAPTPFKKKIEQEKLDPDTRLPMLDADGKVITEEKTVQIPMYKVVSVFDVAQTEGKPLPELAANLTGDVQNYEVFMEALRRSAPVPIRIEQMAANMDGYFSLDEQRIAIREGMSEVQTVSAAVHEIAHSKLHNYEKVKEQAAAGDEAAAPVKHKSRETEEVEAESVSYAVCAYYGISTGENSFGYIATWSKDKELPELRASLETINKTSNGLITDIDRNYAAIMKERGLDKAEPEQAVSAAEKPANEVSEPYFEYKLHANPRSVNEKDAAFVQAYEHRGGQLYPADIIGFGAYSDFIPLVNRLNEEKVTPEEAVTRVRGLDDAEQANPAAVHQPGTDEPEMRYPMPDPTITIEDMHSYGYTDGDMLPVSKERAQELIAQDVTIYGLKQGDRFVRVSDPWEVNNYDGMLGINTEDWEEMWETLPPSALRMDEKTPIDADRVIDAKIETYDPSAPLPTFPPDYPMPDDTVTIAQRDTYGYTENDMLPLSREKAAEFMEKDATVYMLVPGNAASMAFDMDDIDQHNGLFGIRREDWEQEREYLELTAGHELTDTDLKNSFLNNPADAFAIYQLKHTEDTRDLRFESLAAITAAGLTVEHENYELVYTDSFTKFEGTQDRLEELFDRFNNNRPEEFRGHSLSVSDIIALKQNGAVSYHYVDSFDFAPLPDFIKPENYLKNAEMATEDDYGMIDGIVNNGVKQPTVAELEQQAKSGTPISLMDLAAASHRERDSDRKEKRPSVLAQLKSHQEKEKTSIAPKKSAEREL